MAEIVSSVRAALQPLIADHVVTDVRLAGVAGADGSLKPIVSVMVAGEKPEEHAGEISRLIHLACLDVQWVINTETLVT